MVGVGTVMDATVCDLADIAKLGGRFALSPIDPLGFIDECHRLGLLAVPAGSVDLADYCLTMPQGSHPMRCGTSIAAVHG